MAIFTILPIYLNPQVSDYLINLIVGRIGTNKLKDAVSAVDFCPAFMGFSLFFVPYLNLLIMTIQVEILQFAVIYADRRAVGMAECVHKGEVI